MSAGLIHAGKSPRLSALKTCELIVHLSYIESLLKEQELIQICVSNLLHGFDVVAGDELVIRVEEFDASLFEGPLRQEESLDPRETCFMNA